MTYTVVGQQSGRTPRPFGPSEGLSPRLLFIHLQYLHNHFNLSRYDVIASDGTRVTATQKRAELKELVEAGRIQLYEANKNQSPEGND
jgi:hypothetical protein